MGKTRNVIGRNKAGLVHQAAAHLALWSLLTAPGATVSHAAITSAPGQGPGSEEIDVDPTVNPTLPPDFATAGIANQGQIFKDCRGQVKDALLQGIQQLAGLFGSKQNATDPAAMIAAGNFGLNTECTGNEIPPSPESMTCENLGPGTGIPSPAAIRQQEMLIGAAMRVIECKKLKFAAARGELNCLTSESNLFAQQVSSIQGAYQENIQRMQNDVQKINTVFDDRCSQGLDVLERLGEGTPSQDCGGQAISSNGSKGLLAVRDGLCLALNGAGCGSVGVGGSAADAANSITGQIRRLSSLKTQLETSQKKLDETIADRTMGIATQCFTKEAVSGLHCDKGVKAVADVSGKKKFIPPPPVSPLDGILCRYEQSLAGKDSRGNDDRQALESGGVKSQKNATRAGDLRALLSTILSEVPQETPLDQNGQPDVNKIRAPTLLTADEIEKQFGAKLEEFSDVKIGTKGETVHSFVKNAMQVCFGRAETTVKKEKGLAGSVIGGQQIALNDAKEDFEAQAKTTLAANTSRFNEAVTALTGGSFPIDTERCDASGQSGESEGAVRDRKINCVKEMEKQLSGLLNGTLKQSTIKMSLTGTDPKTNLFFECKGLNGCIAALQSVDRNLKKEVKRVKDFKKKFVTQANQSIDNFTKKMVDVMGVQNTALNTRFLHLNNAFRSLGVNLLTPKITDCEPPAPPDEDGLKQAPQNAMKFIGCQMNPKMIDVNSEEFTSSLASMTEAEAILQEKSAPIQASMARLSTLAVECKSVTMGKRLNALLAESNQLASGNCDFSEEFCSLDAGPLSNLALTLSDIDGVGMHDDVITDIGSSLNAGIGGCAASQQIIHENRVARQKAEDREKEAFEIDQCRKKESAQHAKQKQANNATPDLVSSCSADPVQHSPPAPPGGVRTPAGNCRGIARNIGNKILRLQSAANGGSSAGGAQ